MLDAEDCTGEIGPPAARRVALAVLLVPVFLLFLWHLCNHGLPNDDAANYAQTAVEITTQFHRGIVPGAISLLGLRGWRPTAFPPIAVPFLLLTADDVVAACAAMQLCIYTALVFYLYGLARQCAATPLVAAAAATSVASLPAIDTYFQVFFSESAWLLFSIACVYHLLRSGPFRRIPHALAAGVFAGLMVTIRPAESFVILLALMSFSIAEAVRSKAVSLRSVLISLGVSAVPAGLLVLSTWVKGVGRLEIWVICAAAMVFAVLIARHHNAPLLAFLGGLVTVACIWWAAYMPALFSWVHETSFGRMAQIMGSRAAAHPLTSLIEVASFYGAIQMALLAGGLAAVTFVLLGRAIRRRRDGDSAPLLVAPVRLLFCASLTLLALFVGLYLSSGTGDPRRILVALALSIVATIVIGGGGNRLSLALIYCVPVIQCAFLLTIITGSPLRASFSRIGQEQTPLRSTDGNLELVRMIAPSVPAGSRIAVYTLALFQPSSRVYEPAALKLASVRGGYGYEIGYRWDTADYTETLSQLRESNYQFLLLDSFPAATSTELPYVQFATELLRRVQSGVANPPGLRMISRFSLGDRQHTLYRIMPPAPIFGAEGLAFSLNGAKAFTNEEQKGYPAANLNDGTPAPWGSLEGRSDVYAAVVLPAPHIIHHVRIKLFSPGGYAHLRNVRIVTAEGGSDGPAKWQFVRARLAGEKAFSRVLTIPPMADMSEVVIELDPKTMYGARTTWGIACLRSQGDLPNYLPAGTGVYVREIGVD